MLLLGVLQAQAAGGVAGAGSFDLLETQVLANNSTTSIQFLSGGTWASYSHLQLRVAGRQYWTSGAATGSNLRVTLNNTGSTYKGHFLRGNGSAVASSDTSINTFSRVPVSTATTSAEHGAFVLDILDINNTSKNTTMRSLGGMAYSYGYWIELASSAWFTTDAITSLEVVQTAGFLGSGSRFSLYGSRAGS
jgi:hypothetical protein